jgi:hypothetical protein
MNKTYTENYTVNIKDFESSYEFSNHLYDFISKFACNKSIIYPTIIYIDLYNEKNNISLLFIYPYIDKNVSYDIFFRENIDRLFIKISYMI